MPGDEGDSQARFHKEPLSAVDTFTDAESFCKALRAEFKAGSAVDFHSAYPIAVDPMVSPRTRIQMVSKEIWELSGYQFMIIATLRAGIARATGAVRTKATFPTVTAAQIRRAWVELSEPFWCFDDDQLLSTKKVLEEHTNHVDIFEPQDVPEGKIVEIRVDTTYNTNSKHLELYSIIGEQDGAGFPLSYLLLSTASLIDQGKRTQALTAWARCVHDQPQIRTMANGLQSTIPARQPPASAPPNATPLLLPAGGETEPNAKELRAHRSCALAPVNNGTGAMAAAHAKCTATTTMGEKENIVPNTAGGVQTRAGRMTKPPTQNDTTDPAEVTRTIKAGTTGLVAALKVTKARKEVAEDEAVSSGTPSYYLKLVRLLTDTGQYRELLCWRKAFKRVWWWLEKTPITLPVNPAYKTDTKKMICTCPSLPISWFLLCKHVVQEVVPIPPVFFLEVKRQCTAPFWVHLSLRPLSDDESAHEASSDDIHLPHTDTAADTSLDSEDEDNDDLVDTQPDDSRTFVEAIDENIDLILEFAQDLKFQRQFRDQCMLQTLEREGASFL
ncbi:hypothetical protein B0H14DRAFT_2638082 [Mycena olivaceomarginata]|nr:hypothetical protein B0H14DRAFT_2638082 [Mycena olivaceomarginata]